MSGLDVRRTEGDPTKTDFTWVLAIDLRYDIDRTLVNLFTRYNLVSAISSFWSISQWSGRRSEF